MTGKRQAATKKKRQKNTRPTLGLLTGGISDELGTSFLAGVADAAAEQDANLIAFPGEILNSPNGFEAQANVLYNLVTAGVVDGLVLDSGLLSHYIGPKALQDFCTRYGDIPLVSVEVPLAGSPSVLTDFYQGMRQVMTHLIEEHGYRRIAFIRGPEEAPTAQDRYRAYQDALAEHDIPLDMDLVAPGIFFAPSGEEAVRLLLDERKVEFEAIAAGNDFMAVDAMQALQARGIRVPADVAVTGFDNFGVASVVAPPLTTVRLDNYGRAQQAAEILLTQLGGEAAPEQVARPAEVVVRQSCGCPSVAVVETAAGPVQPTDEPLEVVLVQQREQILSEMEQVGSFTKQAGRWAEQLLDAFVAELIGESTGAFLSAWVEVLGQVAAAGHASRGPRHSVTAWQGVLSVLRRHVMPALGSQAAFAQAEDLWQQARVMIGETAERIQLYRNLESEQQAGVLREVGQMLIATHDVAELMDTLVEQLPRLGIKSCYLSLYEDPRSPAEWAKLALAYCEGERFVLDEEKKRFASPQLMPEGLLPQDRRYQLIVQPLYFREGQIGFTVFEFEQGTPQKGLISEALRGQISSALKSAMLVQQEEKRARQLQTVAEVSTATSTILDTADLLQQVVSLTKERFGLYHAHIYLLDNVTNDLVLAAGAGEVGRKMVAEGWKIPLKREQSLVARAARNWAGVIVNNVQEEPGWLPNKDLPQTRSELAVPLLVGERVLGVLDVQSDEVDHFTADDIQIQMTLAAQVATALENARLFEQAQRADSLLRERVKELDCLNDIGREMEENPPPLPELLEWITRRIPPAMQFSELALAAIKFEGQVYGEPKAVDLPTQIVHGLYVDGEILGRIYIAYTEKRDFIDEESALLGGIATRVSGFIENRRLFEQTLAALTQVEQSQHFLRTLIDNIPNPVFYKDANGAYLGFNRAFLEYLGQTEEGLIGKTVYDLNTNKELADRYHEADMAVFRNPGDQVYEASVKHADGTLRDVIFNKAAFTNPDGSLGGLVGVMVDITERKRMEEALRENEARLSDATDIAQLGYWELDFQTQIFTFTDQLYALLRTTAAQEGGYQMPAMQYAQKFVHPEDAHLVGAEIQKAVETADPDYFNQVEHRIIRADGSEGFILVRFRIIKDAQGRTIKSIGANQDITERRQAEEIIRQNEARLAEAADIAQLGYWEFDYQTQVFTVTDQLWAMFRTTAEEQGGYQMPAEQYAQKFVHPDDAHIVGAEIQKGGESAEPDYSGQVEFRIIRADGSEGFNVVRYRVAKDEQGRSVKAIGIGQDITERKQAEEELHKLSRAVEQSASTVVITDTKGNIEYVNPRFVETTGYTVEEAIGQHTRILKSGETSGEEYKAMWETIIAGGEWHGQFHNKKKNGELYWESAIVSPIKDEKGEITHFLAVKEEITERKEAETERERLLAEVQQSQELLRTVVDATPDWIFIKDQEHRYRMVNQGYANALHLAPEDFIGNNDLELGFPEELVKGNPQKGIRGFWADDRLVMDSGDTQVYPDDPATIDGEVHTFHTIKTPLKNSDGQVWGVLAFARDITERKQAEAEREELLANVHRLAAIVENHPDFIAVGTLEGKPLYLNPAGLRMVGLPADHDVTAMDALDFFSAEDAERLTKEGISTALEKGFWSTEANLLRADGKTVPVEETISIQYDADGKPTTFSVTMHDISNRQVAAAEQARLLAEVEASYRQYVRQEWEQYLQEQRQGQWHIEQKVQDIPFDADLTPLQEEVIREQATKTISHRPGDGRDVSKSEPAAIVSPLSLRGQVIGTLNLQDAAPDRIWSDEEIALVEAVSEQLALTVENLRLFDDTQRRATREQLTRQITDKIHMASDVDTIIQTGLTELAKVLGASRTYVKLKPALEQEQNPETLTLVQENVGINIDKETTP